MTISLRRRILLGNVVLTALVVGVTVGLAFAVVRWQAVQMLDRELSSHAQRMRFMAQRGPPEMHPDLPTPKRVKPGWDGEKRRLFVDITDAANGRSLMRPDDSPAFASMLADLPDDTPAWCEWPDGRRLRVMRTVTDASGTLPSADGGWLPAPPRIRGHFAIDATAIDAELTRLSLILLAVWITATMLAVLAAWWLQRSVTGPLGRMADDLRRIDPERLDGRVRESVPDEMAPAAQLLNQLLDRLRQVRERESRTIVNIAHELRSPVSGLRTALEVAALDNTTTAPALAERLLPTVTTMHAMIANLLALARLEAGQERFDLQTVDLDRLLASCWTQVQSTATAKHMQLRHNGRLGMARTCPDKLRMIVSNLLDNAVAHAPHGAEIELHGIRSTERTILRISNPCAGPLPDLDQIYTPFWRGDAARSSPQHCGLGLPLARRLSDLLGATLTVELQAGRFVASLALPCASDDTVHGS